MRLLERLGRLLRRRPKSAEDRLKEAELLARQRDFELTKARYRN
jgi:hypothetical protein